MSGKLYISKFGPLKKKISTRKVLTLKNWDFVQDQDLIFSCVCHSKVFIENID